MDKNTVFIGNKPLMNYVLAIVTQFNTTDTEEVLVKARGRAISTAVDVAEVTRNRFLPDMIYKEIKLGTDVVKREDGSDLKISSFEIVLSRPSAKKQVTTEEATPKTESKKEKAAAKKEPKKEKAEAKKD